MEESSKSNVTFNIYGGNNQILPNATHAEQHFYGNEFAEKMLAKEGETGASSSDDEQRLSIYINNVERRRGYITMLRSCTSAKEVGEVVVAMRQQETTFTDELANNASLDESQRKLGMLIVRLFKKVLDFKKGAEIDAETMNLIEEVFDTVVKDDSIIDMSHLNYTDTFKNIIVEILQKSIHESNNPILRHIYKNMLDIEQLLSQYFYGFYTGQTNNIRDYLYISWILWAYLVSEEQRKSQEDMEVTKETKHTIYAQLEGKDCQVITFNYTSYASQASPTALYFHGSLKEYVDVENKNDFLHEDLTAIDIEEFFKNQLAAEISFDPAHKSIPIPSFLPPLKLRPVISKHYIDTWYHASQMVLRASKIIILGYSFSSADNYFCDMLRENHDAQIIIIDKNMESTSRNVCRSLQLDANRYSKQIKNGNEIRKYNNRVTIIGADLADVNLDEVEHYAR